VDDARSGFDVAWAHACRIEGWLTREQARVLHDAALAVPPGGTVVEIGSHHGRSTVVLAAALTPPSRLVAVDPFDPHWRYGGPDTETSLRSHLAAAGLSDRVELLASTSRAARAAYPGEVALLYIDGKHDYWTVRDDLRWASFVPEGGLVLVHDAFASLGVTLALLRTVPSSPRLAYVGRVGSLARLEVRRARASDRLRPLRELPWFGRNLLVKVLLRLRLRSVARLLGHADATDPF
jgi:predicted O-methyltransferase YrrM